MGDRKKLAVLAVSTGLVAGCISMAILSWAVDDLAAEQASVVRALNMQTKRQEQENYMAHVMQHVREVYDTGTNDEATKERLKATLRSLAAGAMNGQLFVTDYTGHDLLRVSGKRPQDAPGEEAPGVEAPGDQDTSHSQDLMGVGAVPQLISRARAGGGFEQYMKENPHTHVVAPTLGYVEGLERWKWIVGTEVYLDDIDETIVQLQAASRRHADRVAWSIFGLVVAISLATCLIVYKLSRIYRGKADTALHALNQRILRRQEEERAQVARELHDGISQLIVSAKFAFESADSDPSPETKRVTFRRGIERLQEAVQEIRLVSHGLRSPLLDNLGLPVALTELSREFSERTGLDVECNFAEPGVTIPEHIATALYRIAQEALSNIERHAVASRVVLSFAVQRGFAVLSVVDNGRGFDQKENSAGKLSGLGLRNMRERARAFNGRLSIASSGKGTTILVRVIL